MSRQVFISFLGTSNYLETHYVFSDGQISAPVRFIQEALIVKDCSEWTDNDKILIFCTEQAWAKNWKDEGWPGKIGLEQCLKKNYPHPNIIEMVPIPDGFSEDELWSIFNAIDEKLQEGDRIFFDVTHAFRSIPLFSSVLFNYSRFMKKTAVVSVQYGAFEKLGNPKDVSMIPVEQRLAPVLDLTSIIRLEQFTDMASSLKTYGRMDFIGKTLEQYEQISPSIRYMKKGIEDFDEFILLNRMEDIKEGKWMITISNAIKSVRRLPVPIAMKKILDELELELTDFKPYSTEENIEAAIHWAVKYNMLPSAYTLGQEYIVSLITEKLEDKNPFHFESARKNEQLFRKYISALCSIRDEIIEKREFADELKENENLTLELLSLPFIRNLRQYYPLLGKNRNSLNHAKGSDKPYSQLLSEFEETFNGCLGVIKT